MKSRSILAVILIISLSLASCRSQHKDTEPPASPKVSERWQATDYRNQNWKPENGQYFFSEQWTWDYYTLHNSETQKSGQYSIYLDPPTGTMLLTPGDAGYMDEMTHWIMARPEERVFWQAYADEHGVQKIDVVSYDQLMTVSEEERQANFKKYLSKTGEFDIFGENAYGWETVQGDEYMMTFEMTNDTSYIHLTTVPFSVDGLYLFDKISIDYQLPMPMDYMHTLPTGYLIARDRYDMYGVQSSVMLHSISPTEYFVDINEYKMVEE